MGSRLERIISEAKLRKAIHKSIAEHCEFQFRYPARSNWRYLFRSHQAAWQGLHRVRAALRQGHAASRHPGRDGLLGFDAQNVVTVAGDRLGGNFKSGIDKPLPNIILFIGGEEYSLSYPPLIDALSNPVEWPGGSRIE